MACQSSTALPDAVKATGANTSIIFVPAPFAADAIIEATDAGVKLVVCITDGVPTLDMVKVVNYARAQRRHYHRSELPRPDQPG